MMIQNNLRQMEILSGKATFKIHFGSLLKRGSTLKGKNLVPLGVNASPFRVQPLSEGDWCAEKPTRTT